LTLPTSNRSRPTAGVDDSPVTPPPPLEEPERDLEVRPRHPPPLTGSILLEKALYVGPFAGARRDLEGLRQVQACLLRHAEPEVELSEHAAWPEGVGGAPERRLEVIERVVDPSSTSVGDRQHGASLDVIRVEQEGPLEELDRLRETTALERALG